MFSSQARQRGQPPCGRRLSFESSVPPPVVQEDEQGRKPVYPKMAVVNIEQAMKSADDLRAASKPRRHSLDVNRHDNSSERRDYPSERRDYASDRRDHLAADRREYGVDRREPWNGRRDSNNGTTELEAKGNRRHVTNLSMK